MPPHSSPRAGQTRRRQSLAPAIAREPFSIKLAPLGQGKFAADISELALAGRWQIRLDALITDFEKAIFRGEVEIK